jgi:histidyl-tRNA synthetase
MDEIIEPRVLKGFRDYLPEAEIGRKALADALERVFRSFGFVPIDTPALEYAEILLGKGGGETDKQVYRFRDHGNRDVALRFDLTVPFARFMAEHVDELYLPFRRYHMAKVWRGENTQRGRYREFMQCDFDIVGTEAASADADTVLVIAEAMTALEVGDFAVRINHRGLFNRFLENAGLREKSAEILRLVDKLEKIGAAEVERLLIEDVGEALAAKVLEFIRGGEDFEKVLSRMEEFAGGPGPDTERLRAVWADARASGIEGRLVLDPSITRGLDYYTGIVFETTLTTAPQIGSVCGGGRYDELAGTYTRRRLPGVGASVGLDRLLAALEAARAETGAPGQRRGYTKVLVLNIEDGFEPDYHARASALRRAGIACEVFPEKRKLGQQFSYAERKGIPYALVLGGDEAARGVLVIKDLVTRESREYGSVEALASDLKNRMHE